MYQACLLLGRVVMYQRGSLTQDCPNVRPSSAQTRRAPARLLTLVASTKHLNPAAEMINSSLPVTSGSGYANNKK